MGHEMTKLLLEARHILGWTQAGVGNALGLSTRTIQRWDARGSSPTPDQLALVVRAVWTRDPSLATRLARAGGTSPQELGLAAPQPQPPPPSPPPFAPSSAHLVDSIACAAADALSMTPEALRPALRAAFERARDLRLSPADVVAALTPAPAADEGKPAKGKTRAP